MSGCLGLGKSVGRERLVMDVGFFCVLMKMFYNYIMMMVAQFCKHNKIIHFKWMDYGM